MKNFKLIITFLFFASGAFAQQNYFIYLQTENQKPFYVKLDKQVLLSSSTGYLVIPKLTDGNYVFGLGFPRTSIPEHQVSVKIDKKDAGYIIKNIGDNGWGLANVQTSDVIMAVNNFVQPVVQEKEMLNDPYSVMLAKVVNDPSIREKEDIIADDVKVQADKAQEGKEEDKAQVVKEEDKK